MKKIGLVLIAAIAMLSSCNTKSPAKEEKVEEKPAVEVVQKDNIVLMTVASEKRTAMGVGPMEVLLVKEGDAKDWSFFYDGIEGFNFEPGFEYVLEVKTENVAEPVPADASSIKYTLVKEVSKTQKTSENMLENIPAPKK